MITLQSMIQNNYQKFLDTVSRINECQKPSLLLHVCCAPCSTTCLEILDKYFDITVFFYNPNISPLQEYQKRLGEEQSFLSKMYPHINIIEVGYENEKFVQIANGLEHLTEGGERCKKCYKLRLERTGNYAKQKGYDYFTTTLTVSPYKNSNALNQIGEEIADKLGIKYLTSDFKKNDGYKRSITLSKEHGLYRQDYCGCQYSKQAKERLKLKKQGEIV